jgi:hypothetical protein
MPTTSGSVSTTTTKDRTITDSLSVRIFGAKSDEMFVAARDTDISYVVSHIT